MNFRVFITGVGVITSIGIGKENFWSSLAEGVSGIGQISSFDPSLLPVQIASEVRDFRPQSFIFPREMARMDRFAQFALAAAKMALEDGGLECLDSDRAGVIVSSSIGGIGTLIEQETVRRERGANRVSPFFVPMMMANSAAAFIAIEFKARGYSSSPVTACASSLNALGEAYEVIRRGDADLMIAGGAEAAILPLTIAGFSNMRALSATGSRPFDQKRDGFVLGEGAGILLLESGESARRRNAHIYAEIVGYGCSNDAYHITAPEPEARSVGIMIEQTLKKSGVKLEEVDYVNAHGTSTPLNDRLETLALKKVFGEHSRQLLISSTKSMIGHLLGAAGAVETIASLLPLEKGIVPPTINYRFPDPDCDLNYVPNKARQAMVRTVLKTSYGFGGHNACLVLKKVDS